MKRKNVSMRMLTLGLVTVMTMSCKEAKKEAVQEKNAVTVEAKTNTRETTAAGTIIDSYLELKDALVADSQENAAKAGETMLKKIAEFDMASIEASEQSELKAIIATAKDKATQITKGDIATQRAHFEGLSSAIVDFVAIAGTPTTLYQQFCPMYNNNKGGMWVSAVKAVKNPYFGSGMLNCGFVQAEIN
ncbi:Protein of unknown function [Arenibacter nanhaiticus]|uniref:DUF3347 domain-containing protein n=1 Tax=Arenibacter nanhaiticus TaxID=558155 RepID=A0A1M6CRF0_9FLAO|nr:DUF3347 domain-containing protein [Arenibacter nanhaiticus]SHI63665.1 Protein of unknown function [Arenibacter nanhaiticus]